MKNKTKISLAISHPDITKQWHPTKNGELKPTDFTAGSNKKVWWQCEKGHEWVASINHRTKGRGCSICSNKKVLVGYNDLATTNPDLAKEWHPTQNGELKPTDVAAGSCKKVWWRGKCGHEWEAQINTRTKGSGCPYCAGQKVLAGFTDLATTNPDLAKEWHPTKNGELKPTDVAAGSGKKVWWKCEHGHEWETVVINRRKGSGCPYCSGRYAIQGFTDLATTNPDLAKEWHPTQNNDLKPTDVTVSSNKKVWWRGKCGHEWEARINSRTSGNGCPYCSGKKVLTGFNDLTTTHSDLAKQWHPIKNGELKPTDVSAGSGKKVWWQCEHGHEWATNISGRTRGNGCPYCSHNGTSKPELILLYYIRKYFNVKIEHRYRGFGFEIDIFFNYNSEKIGIEYDGWNTHKDKKIKDINKNQKCEQLGIKLYRFREKPLFPLHSTSIDLFCNPYDYSEFSNFIKQFIFDILKTDVIVDIEKDKYDIEAFFKLIKVEESLATNYPKIAKEWHPTKNGNLKPDNVSCGTNEKVWWICEHGHEWQAQIRSRTSGCGCPYCSGRYAIQGFTDLATTHPELTKEWHPTKNGNFKPTDAMAGSGKKVWWRGKCGHEWEATIFSRIKGAGCPICSHRKLLIGYNDLATTHPELTKQWHPTKNGNLKPTDISAGSGRKIWWKCEHGHEWETTASYRSRYNSGCPHCKTKEKKNEK